jgi:hypothetical protein
MIWFAVDSRAVKSDAHGRLSVGVVFDRCASREITPYRVPPAAGAASLA